MNVHKVSTRIGERELSIETGKLAKQADGAVIVTYGDTSTNSIDVSPDAYQILNEGEYPRDMTWQLAECPDTGPMMYEFQTGSSEYWTSLWVRSTPSSAR